MDDISLNKGQLVGIAAILFLLIAIPLTFYLVRQTQIFKPKAVGTGSRIEFYANDTNTEITTGVTTSDKIKLKLIYESGVSPSPTPINSTVSGSVRYENGSPAAYRTVYFCNNIWCTHGVSASTTTDISGNFSINIDALFGASYMMLSPYGNEPGVQIHVGGGNDLII